MNGEKSIQFRLFKEIIALSVADNWDEAKREWELMDIHREDEPDTCLCGHAPIIELCELKNRKNGNWATVGNVCVKKFLGFPSELIFSGLRRIAKDHNKALNEAAVHHAYEKNWITKWERDFCLDTSRKRELSDKQYQKRQEINLRVLTRTKNSYVRREP